MDKLISQQAAIDALRTCYDTETVTMDNGDEYINYEDAVGEIEQLPSAQPVRNITMTDVLKYIDDMPEDVWQEFTACLECRGWELQRRTAKWCGGDFA